MNIHKPTINKVLRMFHAMNLEVAKTDVIDNPWDYVNDLESKIRQLKVAKK